MLNFGGAIQFKKVVLLKKAAYHACAVHVCAHDIMDLLQAFHYQNWRSLPWLTPCACLDQTPRGT